MHHKNISGEVLKILVSNDDGIYSKGIYELVKALKEIGEVLEVTESRVSQLHTKAILKLKAKIKKLQKKLEKSS